MMDEFNRYKIDRERFELEYFYSTIMEYGYSTWFDSIVFAPGDNGKMYNSIIQKTKNLIQIFEDIEEYERCAYLLEEMTKKISEYERIDWEEVEREIIQSYENEWEEIEMIGNKIKN
jgi:hypothetical protein